MPLRGFPPFRDLPEDSDALSVSQWHLRGEPVGNASVLPAWGYDTALRFERLFTIRPQTFSAETGVGAAASLRVVTSWSASASINLGAVACDVEVRLGAGEAQQVTLSADVPSPWLAETLKLTTVVLLQARGRGPDAMAATLPGSILWKDAISVTLEGTGSRLPVQAIDFSQFPTSESSAVWFVWTGPDWLYRHPTAGIVVYLNSQRPVMVSALTNRRPDTVQQALQSMLFHDVGRALFEVALDDDDFSDDSEFPKGSAGESLRASLRTVFRHQSINQIRVMRRQESAAFNRALQTRHKLLRNLK